MHSGRHIWQFHFLENGKGYVGVAHEQQCGFRREGLFYGGVDGTLNDGIFNVASFGEMIYENDKIQIVIELGVKSLQMSVFHNNHPLGTAFNITEKYRKPLFPAFKIFGECRVSVSKLSILPEKVARDIVSSDDSIEGYWQIEQCEEDGEIVSNLNWTDFEVWITEEGTRRFPRQPLPQKAKSNNFLINFYLDKVVTLQIKQLNETNLILVNNNFTILPYIHHLNNVNEMKNARFFFERFTNKFFTINHFKNKIILSNSVDARIVLKRCFKKPFKPLKTNPLKTNCDL
ncbi:hypothetical protein B4U79_16488 [Dinothrombium tinctorium]|uniref:B30.2/SPRY domain-containing protein n=1 Tax=Dinothrombium tinctorium TaxID=1965070 RepID=A0A3S3NUS8_9ACAR|nr:hypothetical protein B4U79_16776 [Dinothrombium tinctorium]RWS02282.1 hypothetical protein B4U79_16636 [Dinothrombium tinctorium]RWS02298.1 hypothetical protein B4U79_16632 [Dinothrombium tinctorium]RWS03678.1 hypothetical protein B4U79_16488 [Dinothrombium tinctorium]